MSWGKERLRGDEKRSCDFNFKTGFRREEDYPIYAYVCVWSSKIHDFHALWTISIEKSIKSIRIKFRHKIVLHDNFYIFDSLFYSSNTLVLYLTLMLVLRVWKVTISRYTVLQLRNCDRIVRFQNPTYVLKDQGEDIKSKQIKKYRRNSSKQYFHRAPFLYSITDSIGISRTDQERKTKLNSALCAFEEVSSWYPRAR